MSETANKQKSDREAELKVNAAVNRKYFLISCLSLGIFLILWQCAVDFRWLTTIFIESPLSVLQQLIEKTYSRRVDGGVLHEHILNSLSVVLSGFFLAVIIGVPLGLTMGWYRLFERFIRIIFEIIRPIPTIAWIPIVVLFLGIGLQAKALIIFFSAFIAIVINSYTGIRLTNPVFINVAKTCGAPGWRIFLRVGVPAAMPMVFAGMRIAIGTSWGAVVAAEMLAAGKGLGYMISLGRTYMEVGLIMGGIIVIGVMGFIFTAIFDWVESKVLKWRPR